MYRSITEIKGRYEPGEIVELEKRVDCYTWCYPLDLGEFRVSEIWDKNETLGRIAPNLTLYFHVPYCRFVCNMCPFTHEMADEEQIGHYVEAVRKEMDFYSAHRLLEKQNVTSIYFGGGTASLLSVSMIEALLSKTKEIFQIDSRCQITVECHPRTVDEAYLAGLKSIGVNRVSFGLQSFQQELLDSLSLRQLAQNNKEVIRYAKKIGFETVAADLMYNFPGQSLEDLERDLKTALDLGIQNLSLYAIDPQVRDLSLDQGNLEQERTMFYRIYSYLSENGYVQTAQPDYSLPGHENRQIVDLWGAPQAQNLGFGAGAFSESFNGFTWANIHHPKEYIRCIEEGKIPILMGKKWSKDEEMSRYAALGVRCLRIDMDLFYEMFGVDFLGIFKYEIELLRFYGYVEQEGHELLVTQRGKFYIDNISKMFFSYSNRGKTQLWGCKLRDVVPENTERMESVRRGAYYGKQ